MDFNQLMYFNTVATLENMSRASEVLHVSQSALSKNILKLEEEIGYNLFDRNGKKIKLNAAGSKFLQYSKEALQVLDAGIKDIEMTESGIHTEIKICVIGGFGRIVDCFASFYRSNPDVLLDISEFGEDYIPDMNKYDIVICPDLPKYRVFEGYTLANERQYIAVSTDNPYSKELVLKLSAINRLDMVFIKNGESKDSNQWNLQVLDVHPNKCFYVNSRYLHRQFILSGMASGFVPESCLDYYASSSIKLIPFADPRFNIPVKVAFKRDKHLSGDALLFKYYIIDYFKLVR